MRPRTLWPYQFSNFRIAAVIRPEIVPARMFSARVRILSGRAVGFRFRRFLFAIFITSSLYLYYTLTCAIKQNTILYKYFGWKLFNMLTCAI